ncbi:VanZ family protein [Actinoplanes sp. NPDC049118]|uniref:VanZ family protein n=1 Tax=Actinoplanes sp. NPDC049118 TaxID=3155769 RepID=UPI003411A679
MEAAWRDHGTTIILAALLLPAGGVVAYLWRRRTRTPREAFAEVGFLVMTLPFIGMLFTPQPAPRSVDLVPLHDLPSWFTGDPGTALAQIVGNLLVLAGLGLLPIRFPVLASMPRILGLAVASAVLIETLQWALAIGRVSSIDDVLVNTAGAMLAAAVFRRWWAAEESAPKRRSLPVA